MHMALKYTFSFSISIYNQTMNVLSLDFISSTKKCNANQINDVTFSFNSIYN